MANSTTASKTTGLGNSHASVLLFSILHGTSYCGLLMAIPDNLCTIRVIMHDSMRMNDVSIVKQEDLGSVGQHLFQ